MDTENAHNPDKSYMSGAMFDHSPFSKRIEPIYSIPNLDVVMEKAGLGHVSRDKPSSYNNMLDEYEPLELYTVLKGRDDTNLQNFLRYCLKSRPEYQNRIF